MSMTAVFLLPEAVEYGINDVNDLLSQRSSFVFR